MLMKRQLVIVMAVKHNTLATLGARSIAKEERKLKKRTKTILDKRKGVN